MSTHSILRTTVFVAVLVSSSVVSAQASYPEFGEDYWDGEQKAAKGKIFRGAGLTVLGLAAIIPTSIWVHNAFDNPQKYAALGAVASIATISMILHGVNSVVFGNEQKDKANYFLNQYQNDPQSVSTQEEQDYYLYTEKKTTAKVVAFGGVLTAQSLILLTNGIVLGIKKGQGDNIGGAKLWPSFVFGGLLLSAGIAIIVKNAKSYRDLNNLEMQAMPVNQSVMVQPWFNVDPSSGASSFGLSGQMSF